ncbi:MAG: GTP 3',8-cyclase MoaA [Nitrospirae bacterium]|nr:GTP 3',8-cyclase MoaA [Candidatus Troglogloeales bacterium]
MKPLLNKVTDKLNRPLRDLRISIIDRCNFRCVYCMPKDVFGRGHPFLPREKILRFEEIARLARIFASLGVEKVRVTGGEPLLRKEVEKLIAMLTQIPNLDITLTTNGSRLAEKAQALKEAGLNRITVSLDSLDDTVFRAMNDVDFPVAQVLAGIDMAARVGLSPIKINAVIKRGLNDHSILPLARAFRGTGHILRFIEYMDVGQTNGWRMNDVISAAEIIETIDSEMPLAPVDANYKGEVAHRFRYRDGSGEIGIIASVTQPFCADCNRARLSADGHLFTCLFATKGYDLLGLLRSGVSDEQIVDFIVGVWQNRNDRYSEIRGTETVILPKIEMSYLGG